MMPQQRCAAPHQSAREVFEFFCMLRASLIDQDKRGDRVSEHTDRQIGHQNHAQMGCIHAVCGDINHCKAN